MLSCGKWVQNGLSLRTRVQTRCGRLEVGPVENGRLKLRLTAAPVDGLANKQARKLLAKSFGVGITRVELTRGDTGKNKVFLIREPQRIPRQVAKM